MKVDNCEIRIPKQSDWHCEMFGTGDGIVYTPPQGQEPNWFWRWTQYLVFGHRWVKEEGLDEGR